MSEFQTTDDGRQDGRKPWSKPMVIVSKMTHDIRKFQSNIGYEYHETDGVGGGTTQLS